MAKTKRKATKKLTKAKPKSKALAPVVADPLPEQIIGYMDGDNFPHFGFEADAPDGQEVTIYRKAGKGRVHRSAIVQEAK